MKKEPRLIIIDPKLRDRWLQRISWRSSVLFPNDGLSHLTIMECEGDKIPKEQEKVLPNGEEGEKCELSGYARVSLRCFRSKKINLWT